MPQEFTPLFHTRAYATLTEAQRRRYNQLHALYFNEQTMFFEKGLARNVLGHFLAEPLPEAFRTQLERFLAEENQHSAMFHRLNQRCAPDIYAAREFYFVQMPPVGAVLLGFMSKRPRWFPLLLWLMHLQEERAMFFGREFLKRGAELEPHFVAVQRQHLADETGHVRCDAALLDWVWPQTSFPVRSANARLFAWMMEEFFCAPKRAALRVVSAWVKEFPELRPRGAEFRRQLLALGSDHAFRRWLYSPENVPDTFKRISAWPEFHALARVMPGLAPEARA
jgi:hypothetical protein